MSRRLIRMFREHTKSYFGVSEEEMAVAEEKANLLLYPDGEGAFTGGYVLEFWSEKLHKHIGIVFPVDCFDDDTEEDNQEDDE